MMGSTRYTAAAALTGGVVVYNSSSSVVSACDADSSQAATSALRPVGVTARSAATGEEVALRVGGEVSFLASGTISDGDILICEDGAAGAVVALTTTTLASLLADGNPVYTVGRALGAASAGGSCTGVYSPQLISASEPA